MLIWAVSKGCPWDPVRCSDVSRRKGHLAVEKWIGSFLAKNAAKSCCLLLKAHKVDSLTKRLMSCSGLNPVDPMLPPVHSMRMVTLKEPLTKAEVQLHNARLKLRNLETTDSEEKGGLVQSNGSPRGKRTRVLCEPVHREKQQNGASRLEDQESSGKLMLCKYLMLKYCHR